MSNKGVSLLDYRSWPANPEEHSNPAAVAPQNDQLDTFSAHLFPETNRNVS